MVSTTRRKHAAAAAGSVIVDWTNEFDRWPTNAEDQDGKLLEVGVAFLKAPNDLTAVQNQ